MVHEAYAERRQEGGWPTQVERHRPVVEILESHEACRDIFEKARWPDGPVCPNCGAKHAASRLKTRPGLWTCKACRSCQYSATSGTHLHRSRLPVSVWVRLFHTIYIMNRPLTASQISRRYDVAFLTAKSMLRRLEAMKRDAPEMMARLEELLRDLARRPDRG
ncbi:MAG: hypothetical protein C0454_01970 [Parvibaculum sp.]|jgi:ribosomal protein L37AE/L43A|nr:hypothetical protein [Parvibaculum sp.]